MTVDAGIDMVLDKNNACEELRERQQALHDAFTYTVVLAAI